MHFNGTGWEKVSYPGSEDSRITDIWGAGPDDVYVADGGLYYYDGNSWTKQPIDADVIGGTAPDDVYAATYKSIYRFNGSYWVLLYEMDKYREPYAIWVGPGRSLVLVRSTEIIHWDGTRWWESGPGTYVDGVWGNTPDDLYFIGRRRIWHYDGSGWSQMDTPGGMSSLTAIWGADPDNIYAVGDDGQILHYDGMSWTLNEPATSFSLNDV
jgi:hypothetical protein